jgi:hypothetical protein
MLSFGTCKIRFVLVEIKKLLSVAMSRPAPGASGSMFYWLFRDSFQDQCIRVYTIKQGRGLVCVIESFLVMDCGDVFF